MAPFSRCILVSVAVAVAIGSGLQNDLGQLFSKLMTPISSLMSIEPRFSLFFTRGCGGFPYYNFNACGLSCDLVSAGGACCKWLWLVG
jgi:hypothetical protein